MDFYQFVAGVLSITILAWCLYEMRKLKVYPRATFILEWFFRMMGAAIFRKLFS